MKRVFAIIALVLFTLSVAAPAYIDKAEAKKSGVCIVKKNGKLKC